MGILDKLFGKKEEHPAEMPRGATENPSAGKKELLRKKKSEEKEKKLKKKIEKIQHKQILKFRDSVARFRRLFMKNGSILSCYKTFRTRDGKSFDPKGIAHKFNNMYSILFDGMFDKNGNVVGVSDPHYQEIIGKIRHPYREVKEFIEILRTKKVDEIDAHVVKDWESIHKAEHEIHEVIMTAIHSMGHK